MTIPDSSKIPTRADDTLNMDNWSAGEIRTLLNGAVSIERDGGAWIAYITDHRDEYRVYSIYGPKAALAKLMVIHSDLFCVPLYDEERAHPEF